VALYSEVLLKYRNKDKYHITVYFCREYEDADAGNRNADSFSSESSVHAREK
jgi:hypothetical protein